MASPRRRGCSWTLAVCTCSLTDVQDGGPRFRVQWASSPSGIALPMTPPSSTLTTPTTHLLKPPEHELHHTPTRDQRSRLRIHVTPNPGKNTRSPSHVPGDQKATGRGPGPTAGISCRVSLTLRSRFGICWFRGWSGPRRASRRIWARRRFAGVMTPSESMLALGTLLRRHQARSRRWPGDAVLSGSRALEWPRISWTTGAAHLQRAPTRTIAVRKQWPHHTDRNGPNHKTNSSFTQAATIPMQSAFPAIPYAPPSSPLFAKPPLPSPPETTAKGIPLPLQCT